MPLCIRRTALEASFYIVLPLTRKIVDLRSTLEQICFLSSTRTAC